MNLGTVSPVFSSTKQMVVPNDVVGELSATGKLSRNGVRGDENAATFDESSADPPVERESQCASRFRNGFIDAAF